VEGVWEYDYADYAGFFRQEGLNVTTIIVRTSQEQVQALLAGEADFVGSIQVAMESIAAGAPLKVVFATNRLTYALVARPNINSMSEVHSVAFHSRNIAVLLLNNYLLANGLNPEKVQYSYVGSPGLLPAIVGPANSPIACDASNIGAATYNALQTGCRILWSYPQEFPNFLLGGLATTDKMIAEKPGIVKSMVKATYLSLVYLLTHREEAIAFAMKRYNIDREYATFIYEWSYGTTYGEVHLKQPGLPTDMLKYSMLMAGQWLDIEVKPLESWVQTSFWEQVKKELGIS
jgi:ABC-type nitrate/sulfonate/bicarbonate transport system substrate-binding protein